MKDIIYLVVNEERVMQIVYRKPPRLESGEAAIRMVIEVPDEYFRKYIPSVFLTIQPPAEPSNIDVKYDEVATPDPLDRLLE